MSGATPRRDIHRLRWDAGKPLAAAADLRSADEAVKGDACWRQLADGSPCVSGPGSKGITDRQQAAEHLGRGSLHSVVAGLKQPSDGSAIDDPAGGALGIGAQAAGLAAFKQGLIGCGGADQPPCGAGADLTVTLSAMEIRTFLVQLSEARDGAVEQDDPLAALLDDA